MPDENLLFLKDFAAIYTVHSTLVYYALSNYRISTTVKGLQFVCFVTLRWCYSSLLTNFLRYYCISCISVPTLSLQNTCQGNQLRAHQLPQHLLKTSQRICLHILLPLLLIHIYGHNRSIFGRSSKVIDPFAAPVNNGYPPFTGFTHALPCTRGTSLTRHAIFECHDDKSNPLE